MAFPTNSKYVIIGAGIHGLSTAYHLARNLKSKGLGSGEDILVIDKTSIAAGASGIACGVVRNNYFQPAMRELMAHSVSVWESDAEAYSYHPVGYMQISPEIMREDVASIAEQQKAIGYESVFIEGAKESTHYHVQTPSLPLPSVFEPPLPLPWLPTHTLLVYCLSSHQISHARLR